MHRLSLPEYFRRPNDSPRAKADYEKLLQDPEILLVRAFQADELVSIAHSALIQIQGAGMHVPRSHVLIDNFVITERLCLQSCSTRVLWKNWLHGLEHQDEAFR